MSRAIIAIIVVAVLGFGGYLLYQELSGPGATTTVSSPSGVTSSTGPSSLMPPATSSVPSPPVDVDALLARLPNDAKGTYKNKSYDQASGITTVEGLEFTVIMPDPPTPPPPITPPPGPVTPDAPAPTPMSPLPPPELQPAPATPPSDQNGSLDSNHRFGMATHSPVVPANLAPPEMDEPPNMAPPLTDPLNPLASVPEEFKNIEIKVLKVSVDRALMRGLDVAAFESVFDPTKYTATRDETFKPLFDTVTLSGVKFIGDGKEFATIGTVDARQLVMKQFGFIPGGADFEKQFVSPDLMGIQIIGMVADALKVGAMSISNLHMFSEEPEGKFDYRWDTYEVTGIDRGKFGAARSANISMDMADSASGMKIISTQESQQSEGADFSALLPYMIKAEMPPVTETKLISMGRGGAKNLKYSVPGYGEYLLSEVTNEPIKFEWLIPSDLRFAAKGVFKADPNADPMAADMLTQLGQTDFPFDMNLVWTYEGTNGDAKLETFGLKIAGLYGTDFGLSLSGMKLSEFATQEKMEAMMGGLLFSGFTLTVKDDGGTNKLIKIFAKENQMPEADARTLLQQQAIAMGTTEPQDPTMTAIANGIAKFIADPGTLTISAIPAQPVPLMLLMMQSGDPASVAQTLNVKVEATKP